MARTQKPATPADEAPADEAPADEAPAEDAPAEDAPAEVPQSGYVWVTRRRRGVSLGQHNGPWSPPTLIDAKSWPELEQQGYVVVDGPDSTPADDV